MSKNKHTDKKKQQQSDSSPDINPDALRAVVRKEELLTAEEYTARIRSGDRIVLSKAITLVESQREDHQQLARQIIEKCIPHSGQSIRIGITGSPGVGKSTFIENWGKLLIRQGRKLAVLAIDPSSQLSKGSILGDKTRMAELAATGQAYIRPSPAGDALGGVGHCTRSTIILCEAAGFDTILVETVGVGQSETLVHSMVDFFLLLLLPGAGDELQGIKRGIVEMADLIAINKSDGSHLPLAKRSKQSYKTALHLFPPKESDWTPPVVLCSAQDKTGLDEIWQLLQKYLGLTRSNGYFEENRRRQARHWLHETINSRLKSLFLNHPAVKDKITAIESAVLAGKISSFRGAEQLLALFKQK